MRRDNVLKYSSCLNAPIEPFDDDNNDHIEEAQDADTGVCDHNLKDGGYTISSHNTKHNFIVLLKHEFMLKMKCCVNLIHCLVMVKCALNFIIESCVSSQQQHLWTKPVYMCLYLWLLIVFMNVLWSSVWCSCTVVLCACARVSCESCSWWCACTVQFSSSADVNWATTTASQQHNRSNS